MATLAQLSETLLGPARPRRSRRRGRIPRQRPPSAVALSYTKVLRAAVAKLEAMVRARVLPILRADSAERMDAPDGSDAEAIRLALREVEIDWLYSIDDLIKQEVERTAQRVSAHQEAELVKQLASLRGGITQGMRQQASARFGQGSRDPLVRGLLEDFHAENVELIRSIPQQSLAQVREVLADGIRKGKPIEALSSDIEERFNVAKSRATLIARDQTTKLASQLNGARQQAMGVTAYTWRIVNSPVGDSRVRDDHRALDGSVHRWNSPPVVDLDTGRTAHPGEDINCRCTAEPVFDTDEAMQAWFAGGGG